MKTLVALLGLLTASCLPGEAAIAVTITAADATGYLVQGNNVLRGTRLLLICDVEGLPKDSVVNSYRWEHSSTSMGRNEIRRESPYYKPVNDTLLIDATSWGTARRHTCEVEYRSEKGGLGTQRGFTADISLSDSSTPFILTPTSLLLNHSLITDVQQITGSHGQHWINCTRGVNGREVQIISVRNSALISRSTMTATIGPERNLRNGLYYCSDGEATRYYISLFLKNSSNLPTPIMHVLSTTALSFTSPDGNQVERYIVEFECRVRNITFVEKYMSVSASGGTGRVVTSASCFGGLGQLYRVKVWAVSGANISRQPAVKLVNTSTNTVDGNTPTTQVLTSTPTSAGGTGTPDGLSLITQVLTSTPTTRRGTPITVSTPTRSDASSSTPSATPEHVDSKQGGPFIGVGVGVGFGLLLVVLILVASIVVAVVVVKRRGVNKQTGSIKMRANPCYNNPVVVEMEERDVGAEYDDTVINKENGSITDGFDPYEDVDSKAQSRNAKPPPPKTSYTPASATDVGELYAVVDKSKKKGAKTKVEENGSTVTNKDDLYTVPEKKKDKITDKGMGASGGAKKSEDDDDDAELKYEPKADSEPGQQSEGDEKSSNADMLYAVVDKSRKKKK